MGAYAEYLDRQFDFEKLTSERKRQLKRISELRGGRDILVYASDLMKGRETMMDFSDILPIQDQLANLSGKEIDIIIESPGGIAEVAEDMVRLIRSRYERVGMIIPGWAKSAATIFVMAGDEIIMGPASALGPIDAQIPFNGKRFSADAFLEGLESIKQEVIKTGSLNPAYVPILQKISPAEIRHCDNAQEFSRNLVRTWLTEYKFKYWEKHESSGTPVTHEQKIERAKEIAQLLCNHSHWLTHSRSIKISDLTGKLRLKIFDYSTSPELNDAITRYYTLLRMSFDTNLFKIFETPTTQIYRFTGSAEQPLPKVVDHAVVQVECPKCKTGLRIQANLRVGIVLQKGNVAFPTADNMLHCPQCGAIMNLHSLRLQIESQTGKKIVPL